MIHSSINFGNAGIRAVATKEGLIIIFNKSALACLKNGKHGSVDLISGGNKLHVKFMRDTTFKEMERCKELMIEADKEQQKDIEDLAKELVK